MKASYS